MKFFKRLFFIFIILPVLLIIPSKAFSYTCTQKSGNVTITADGALIAKMDKGIAVIKCIQPNVKLKLSNVGGKAETLRLKCSNISPALFGASVKEGEIVKSGLNFVVLKLNLPASSHREIVIAPLKKDLKKYTFAVLGDSRHRTALHRKILAKIAKSNALFAVNLGDIVNHGTKQEYQAFLREIADFPLPYYITPGNHEVAADGGFQRFVKYISPVDYSFDLGDFRFILLDTCRGRITDAQFAWMEKLMKGSKNIFVLHHIPPFSPNPKMKSHILHSDKEAKKLMALMEKYKVKAMFGAHIHAYLRAKRKGIDYIIAGCSGAYPVLPASQGGYPHYILVDVNGENYNIRVFKVDG